MIITFIGGGNMATALIGGLSSRAANDFSIRVVEPDAEKRRMLTEQFAALTADALSIAEGSDIVLLAVKPQQLREVSQSLAPYIRATTLIISIAAGIQLSDLQRWLGGHERLIRVMPNTPALVGQGVSGVYAAQGAEAHDKAVAETILKAVGSVVWLNREEQIDAITAVSGSGPAYVFFFIESLQAAAQAQGFNSAVARQLALETFSGAVKLAVSSEEDAAELRARVTSKGGTTERAIGVLEAAGVRSAIEQAVEGAAARSRELAEILGKD